MKILCKIMYKLKPHGECLKDNLAQNSLDHN